MKKESQPLFSQIGGLVGLVCFFLPWGSCQGNDPASGADLGGATWLVFFAAGLIAASVHYFGTKGELEKAKPIVILCSVVAIFILVLRYSAAREQIGNLLTIEFGGYGSLTGFLLALYGTLFLSNPSKERDPERISRSVKESGPVNREVEPFQNPE